jgi:large subunit ribosomal protein L24
MKSIQPRKQRKNFYTAPLHKKHKWLSTHLTENLLLKYDKRSIPIVKGDTVKVLRGSFRGHEDKIVKVNIHRQSVNIEGLTLVKADGTKIPKPIHPSNLLITKLNLTDSWRRNKLEQGLSETVRKEIEQEAKEQLKEVKEEQKRIEELKKEEELAEEEELTEDIEDIPEPPKEDKPPKKPTTTKTEKKTPTKKPAAPAKKPTSQEKKPAPKKKTTTTTPKKTGEKTPAKPKKTTPKKKKEEETT